MGSLSYLSISIMLAILFLWYLFYVRNKTGHFESILSFLCSNLAISSRSHIEDELLAIRTKDFKPDYFDEIVERSIVLDFNFTHSIDAFNLCADAIHDQHGISTEDIVNVLVEAEDCCGYVFSPKIAVLSAAVSNEADFLELVIFRSKTGIAFVDGTVCNIVFVFYCSKILPRKLLQCFNSLSKSVSNPDFLKLAMSVRNNRNLQELFFFSKRQRHFYSGSDSVVLKPSSVGQRSRNTSNMSFRTSRRSFWRFLFSRNVFRRRSELLLDYIEGDPS
ncbi:hypothetical protein GEMRC1_008612 [Eukaryota sp. GEM-RC1]